MKLFLSPAAALALIAAASWADAGKPVAPLAGGGIHVGALDHHLEAYGPVPVTRGEAHPNASKGMPHPLYAFPLVSIAGQQDFYWISNFVDHDPVTSPPPLDSTVEDYTCGTRSYDLPSGYNHIGVDYTPWPFWWYQMDQENVEVRASAGGVIRTKVQVLSDRQCELSGKASNRIVIEHDDGSFASYLHMKRNSLTSKNVGDSVAEGEFLGLIGSSGNSVAPHLHLETRLNNPNGPVIDPFDGMCNVLNPGDPWWPAGEEDPYYNPAIAQVATHSILVTEELLNPPCPITFQDPKYDNAPSIGEAFYFGVYLRDEKEGDQLDVELRRVGGPVIQTFSSTAGEEVEVVAVSFYAFAIDAIAQAGTYRLDVTWVIENDSKSASHSFEVIGDRLFRDGFSAP